MKGAGKSANVSRVTPGIPLEGAEREAWLAFSYNRILHDVSAPNSKYLVDHECFSPAGCGVQNRETSD
jgi:hypothetical protein